MKIFPEILHRKRGVILFVLAFVLPLMFGIVISIDTFSRRYQTNRNLLESNLWFSGRSALEQFEAKFAEKEKQWLNQNFLNKIISSYSSEVNISSPNVFIISHDLNILYPGTSEHVTTEILSFPSDWDIEYRNYMEKGEAAELAARNYSLAIMNYKAALDLSKSLKQEALAIEGIARSLRAKNDLFESKNYYHRLCNEYMDIENKSGHPYGLIAPLQIFNLDQINSVDSVQRDSIQKYYDLLIEGHWPINASTYYFYKSEYESIIGKQKRKEHLVYENKLGLSDFLRQEIIPSINIKNPNIGLELSNDINRSYFHSVSGSYLVSYAEFYSPELDEIYWGGIRWDCDSIKRAIVPELLDNIKAKYELDFILTEEEGSNLLMNQISVAPEQSLALEFNLLPLPWTLVAIQPAFEKLDSEVKTQAVIYGMLLLLIITLMFFGLYMLLRDMNRERESMLLRTQFVHNVSHELKTPLSLIRLYGETLLTKENLSEDIRKDGLQIITKESERLSHMINNILDFSKIEMGRKEFEIKPGNLSEVIIQTIESYRYHLEKKGFILETNIDKNIDDILFDKNAVEGIFINLLSNAIKFSRDNKHVEVNLKKSTSELIIEVKDRGIGIPARDQKSIFTRFYRAKQEAGFEARGSGLGLTLVKHAVEAHDWEIFVTSTMGQGSTFTIIIPLKLKEDKK